MRTALFTLKRRHFAPPRRLRRPFFPLALLRFARCPSVCGAGVALVKSTYPAPRLASPRDCAAGDIVVKTSALSRKPQSDNRRRSRAYIFAATDIVILSCYPFFYYHNLVISNIINVSFQSKSCKATAQSLFCRNAGAGRLKAPNPLTALSADA